MTEIINTVQLQEVGDSLVDLYDLKIGSETVYLFGGLEDGTTSVWFLRRRLNSSFLFLI